MARSRNKQKLYRPPPPAHLVHKHADALVPPLAALVVEVKGQVAQASLVAAERASLQTELLLQLTLCTARHTGGSARHGTAHRRGGGAQLSSACRNSAGLGVRHDMSQNSMQLGSAQHSMASTAEIRAQHERHADRAGHSMEDMRTERGGGH